MQSGMKRFGRRHPEGVRFSPNHRLNERMKIANVFHQIPLQELRRKLKCDKLVSLTGFSRCAESRISLVIERESPGTKLNLLFCVAQYRPARKIQTYFQPARMKAPRPIKRLL